MSHFITTPIYYVNSVPHLGHAYTTIAADVAARFRRLTGEETFLLTGTDEHGSKVEQAAEQAGVPVQRFADEHSQRFRDLLPLLDVEPSWFVRTTDPAHHAYVQQVLTRIHERGHVYEGTYEGAYCTPCEAYYGEGDLLEGRLCPVHRLPITDMRERNWFFRLSSMQEALRDHFLAHPEWVRPRSRYNEALSFIEGGLDDLSISRSSISWGVTVPWDPDQVFWVWVEALFNYRSALDSAPGESLAERYWPPTQQFLAKDILKFHAVIWPALLMAAGLELPRSLFVHGYLLMGGDKMSKTTGNVFDPFPVIEEHGADPVRFYVLREVQFGQDGTVSRESFEARYDSELANDLGNLVSRTTSMLERYLRQDDAAARVPGVPADSAVARDAAAIVAAWGEHMRATELTSALDRAWDLVRRLNRHVEQQAPWKLAKDPDAVTALRTTLGELAEGLCAVAYMLWPVMPSTSERMFACFDLAPDALPGWGWGAAEDQPVTRPAPLFPRLDSTRV